MDRKWLLAGAAAALILAAPRTQAQPAALRLPLDTPMTVEGVDVACTGIGLAMRQDPRWAAYPVRIEFANGAAEYLSDATVTVARRNGEAVLRTRCEAPWLLVRLPAGDYVVTAVLNGSAAPARTAPLRAPAGGQTRFVITFSQP